MLVKVFCTAVLVAIGAAAAAVPAFTADNASLSVTVTAQPPAVPWVSFATSPGTQVDFGTLRFSNTADPYVGVGLGSVVPRFSNCGTARESLFIAATDAQNHCTGICVRHTWMLGDQTVGGPALNGYQLWGHVAGVTGVPSLTGRLSIGTTNAPLRKLYETNQPYEYAAGETHDLELQIKMPCEGSEGAGEAFGLSVTITAAIA